MQVKKETPIHRAARTSVTMYDHDPHGIALIGGGDGNSDGDDGAKMVVMVRWG